MARSDLVSQLACASALSAPGCRAGEIREQAAIAHHDGRIAAIHPEDGSAALRGDVSVQVVLGAAAQGELPEIRLVGPGQAWTPDCAVDASGLWVSCQPLAEIPKDQALDLEVSFGGEVARVVSVSSEFPTDAAGYLFSPSAEVTRLGEDPRAAEQMTPLLQGADIGLVLEGYAGQPGEYTLRAGRLDIPEGAPALVREPGLTFVQDVVLREDGSFASRPQRNFLSIYVDTTLVQVLIQDCALSGRVADDRLTDLSLEGVLPAISLVQLAEPLGPLADGVLGRIRLDVDTDGDGELDAASFRLACGEAPRIALVPR